jgi:hypothetical protein
MKPLTLVKSLLATTLVLGTPGVALKAAIAQGTVPTTPSQTVPVTVTETQIDNFVEAIQAIRAIQQETQVDLVAAVEAEGLTVEDYNAIATAQRNPDETADLPPAQLQQFTLANQQVVAIRTHAREEMESAIADANLSVAEFEQILSQAQQDPELQAQIYERLSGE